MLVTIEVVENEVFVVDADGVRENTVQSRSLEIDASSGRHGLRRLSHDVIARRSLALWASLANSLWSPEVPDCTQSFILQFDDIRMSMDIA